MTKNVLITGASGCGTSTLGEALAILLAAHWVDLDDIFWADVGPAFSVMRTRDEMRQLLRERTVTAPWVLTGSMMEWGDFLLPQMDAVVFLYVPTEIRLERITAREHQRRGTDKWERDEQWNTFYEWAAGYDTGAKGGRSLPRHEAWLKSLSCPVLRLEGADLVSKNLAQIDSFLLT